MDKKWLTRILIILITMLPIVHAEEIFPNYIDSKNVRLSRCSEAELKVFRIIHVGNAALYMDDCKKINAIFYNNYKLLRFLYDKPIPAKAFKETSEEYLKINLESWPQLFKQTLSIYK